AVVSASATLQASGGLDVMLQIAEKLLRKNPKYISIVAPLVTCTLTILCGTGHVVYTILPIIYDVSIKNNIRPERPMAASTIGSQMGIIARDRKSTRLNSSHVSISYAVFCLKKK